ncbi:unnamed protein product [Rhizophagus irregularis]|nr:unnamed protein product [Rhizophagus irregularis]
MDDHFLNEWEIHLQCQHQVTSNGSILVPLIEYKIEEDEENRIPIPDNEEVKCHPESYYTSRKIDYSDELNQSFTQFEFELSNKIVITEDNHDHEIKMSDSLVRP